MSKKEHFYAKGTSTQEMIQYRERLIKQKEFLNDILSKIEKQILALQVERLHLRNTLLGTECSSRKISHEDKNVKNKPVIDNQDPKNLTERELDLTIPCQNNLEEELEDDEITEKEKQVLNQLDILI